MRLKTLRPLAGGPDIRLHPRITLLIGLLPFERIELVSTAHSLALGEDPVWEGLLDVSGIEMTLTEAAEVIGRTADAAPVMAAEESLADPSVPSMCLDKLREQLTEMAQELSGAEKLRSEMNARVTSARANVDIEAFVKLDRAVGNLRSTANRADRPDPWTGMSNVEGRLVELRRSIQKFDDHLDDLPRGDRVELAGAIADARAAFGRGKSQLPEAARMAEAWRVLDEHRQAVETRFLAEGLDSDGALARLESARAAFCVAEAAAIPRSITKEEAIEVERAHENFHNHREKVDAGLRRGAARERMENARDALSTILESLGFASWSEFRMGNGTVQLPQESMKDYQMANNEMVAAEVEWAHITASHEKDPELCAIEGLAAELQMETTRLVGADPFGPDAVVGPHEALTRLRAGDEASSRGQKLAVDSLRDTLTACGSTGHVDIESPRGVVALGDSWLAVLRDSDAARYRIVHDRRIAASELEALSAIGDASRVDRLDDQRMAVLKADDEVDISRNALHAIAKARIELHVLAATELALAEDHDNRADLIDRASKENLPADSLGERIVVRGPGGALPIVILAGSVDPSRLDPLLALPTDVQVIVIADGEPMATWARSVGADHASVVDCGVLV